MRPNILIAALVGIVPSVAFAGGPTGHIVVINDSGATMNVTVAGRDTRIVGDHERVVLNAPAGDQTLRATYTQLGQTRTLERETVSVRPYDTVVVTLHPEQRGRVLVTNDTGVAASVFADGRAVATLDPGVAQVVRVGLGHVDFEMRTASGRSLQEKDLFVAPYADNVWTVSRPRSADLVVSNPLPISVTVDGVGATRWIAAYGSAVFPDVPIGLVHVVARRSSGQVVDDETVAVRPDGGNWRIDPPRVGLVSLNSSAGAPVTVLSDGVTIDHLGPYTSSVAELAVGWHELVVIDGRGRRVEDQWIQVDPFATASLVVDGYGGDWHATADARGDDGWHGDGGDDGWRGDGRYEHGGDSWHGDGHDEHGGSDGWHGDAQDSRGSTDGRDGGSSAGGAHSRPDDHR